MFYEPTKRNHGLPRDPLKALITPRPIGWIGSYGANGVSNLAPYSFFNLVGSQPPIVYFGSESVKDSVSNIGESGAFSCNIVGAELTYAMNASSASVGRDVNEFDLAKLTEKRCEKVDAPFVAEASAVLECVHLETKDIVDRHGNPAGCHMVLGEVVGVYISDDVIVDGFVSPQLIRPLARMGYMDYSIADKTFRLDRP